MLQFSCICGYFQLLSFNVQITAAPSKVHFSSLGKHCVSAMSSIMSRKYKHTYTGTQTLTHTYLNTNTHTYST